MLCNARCSPGGFLFSLVFLSMFSRATANSEVHILPVPQRYRQRGVCVGWRPFANPDNLYCWALDDVALVTDYASHQPLQDDFDPVDPANWMFFPGARVKVGHGSVVVQE